MRADRSAIPETTTVSLDMAENYVWHRSLARQSDFALVVGDKFMVVETSGGRGSVVSFYDLTSAGKNQWEVMHSGFSITLKN